MIRSTIFNLPQASISATLNHQLVIVKHSGNAREFDLLSSVHPSISIDGLGGVCLIVKISSKDVGAFHTKPECSARPHLASVSICTHSPRGLGKSLLVYCRFQLCAQRFPGKNTHAHLRDIHKSNIIDRLDLPTSANSTNIGTRSIRSSATNTLPDVYKARLTLYFQYQQTRSCRTE